MSTILGERDRVPGESEAISLVGSLVRKAQAGEKAAFEQLVRMYHRRAVSLAYRLLGNAEDAGDVSQDAFVRAYRSLHQLEDASRFGGWLMRIVSNLSINFRKARTARFAVSMEDLAGCDGESIADAAPKAALRSGSGGGTELTDELSDAVTEAMAELPEQQRMTLVLFSVEGMPQKEVAELLECSTEMVKWNVFQARKRLKEALADYLR